MIIKIKKTFWHKLFGWVRPAGIIENHKHYWMVLDLTGADNKH